MQVGDLVTMAPFNAPPQLYGVGVIVERLQLCRVNKNAVRLRVSWTGGLNTPPRIGNCHPRCLVPLS